MDDFDRRCMVRALELAVRGQGMVEPNPMVGAVLARDGVVIGEGWHQRYGGPHAEIEAIHRADAGAMGATLYVTLEPCCHHGKTPPCTEAILAAGISRVVVAEVDPFPQVSGQGIAYLRKAGVTVEVGLEVATAHRINAPFHCLITRGRPWVIAKWAMSLDGKIATRTGDSRWISNPTSRGRVHQLRGRVDGILVGSGTVRTDDPLLTARPPGAKRATRIVLDSTGTSLESSKLLRTAKEHPVLVATGSQIQDSVRKQLETGGCEVLPLPGDTWPDRLPSLLQELGKRRMTNLLVEGGAQTLGGFLDRGLVDEVQVYLAPKVIGGEEAPSPVAGLGTETIEFAQSFPDGHWEVLDGDFLFAGRRR